MANDTLGIREPSRTLDVPVMRISQPIGDFYVGKLKALTLLEISQFDVRRLSSRDGVDEFLGIQREVSASRIKELRQYITSPDATFPTSIVISVDERCAEFNDGEHPDFGILRVSNWIDPYDSDNDILFRDIAKIIDGQHRIKAFDEQSQLDFDLNIAIFVGPDAATQAEIFSTVNLAQTKVNRSLVYDLFSLTKTRSPEKSAHEITVLLDREKDSPFHHRIKRLGVATAGRTGEVLSQATVVRGILLHITKDAYLDRMTGKRSREWALREGDDAKFIFRRFFVGRDDDLIYINIQNYFLAVRSLWPNSWTSTNTRGNILPRTNGYMALMRFLKLAYIRSPKIDGIVSVHHYKEQLSASGLSDGDFGIERFVPGTGGETALYKALLSDSK